jgi:hypothetical protein
MMRVENGQRYKRLGSSLYEYCATAETADCTECAFAGAVYECGNFATLRLARQNSEVRSVHALGHARTTPLAPRNAIS